ncbi:MAG: inositol monophosphatase [Lachnospiraceae bacterium]|nr:inositol monophosphatase [Lachnospiraceae bacterium]
MNYEKIIELVHSTKKIIMDQEMAHDVTIKGAADYVTKVDVAVQEYLRHELEKISPEVILLAEEQENNNLDKTKSYWILDPIDGTTNLIHDYQMSAVSLALYVDGKIIFGVVYNPFTEETFHAVRTQGAFLNGRSIHVSHRESFADCIISLGSCPYEKDKAKWLFPIFEKVFMETADFRRSASAALDLCYTATGRVDGYFEYNLKPWDYAAGSLIVKEAGGIITDWNGREVPYLENASILVSTPEIYEKLKAFL